MEKREDYFCLVLRSIRSALAVGVGCCFLVGYGREGMAADYMDCQDISVINELADADFISSKKVTVGTKRSLADLQITYYNFLQPPGEASSGNKLFVPVRKDANIGGEFLTCNFANDAVFECENSRLWGASGCTRTTKIRETTGGTASVEINDCAKFDNQKLVEGTSTNPNDANELEKLACYPQNHICNKYKEDIFNNYFNVDGLHFTAEATSTGKFFIYKKLAIPEGASRNCNLVKFSCDMKLKNDSPANGKNIVFKNSTYDNNQKFINNVLAGLGDMAFFKLVGLCIKGNAACLDVLNARHYYKYVNGSSIDSQTTIYYFKKNIIYHNIGVLCNKYLPTCQEIEVDGALSNVLYNNSNNGNDFENRRDFYSDHKNKVQEENLWFVNNNNFANYACLAVHGSDANMNKDVGYCSDLNEEKNNLKYPNGLQTMGSISGDGNLISVPNCYLKSCIDLTPEEFLMIVQNGTKTNKYCSEYRWLSNSKGFKYFPKEKPPYCSDLEEVSGKGEQLVFRQYLFQHNGCDSSDVNANGVCRNPRDIYYSYGGGLNKEKDNCYLKNCYSLSGDERSKISEARLTSIGFELERSYALSSVGGVESAYDESKIPIYCDNGFLFMKDTDNFSDFDYLNLNLIPCFELSPEQMMKIASVGSVNMVLFTDIFKNYNTNNVYKFCRTHYIPLDIIDEKHDENTLFLDYVLTIADETARASANGSYSEFFALGGLGQMSVYNGKKMNDVIFAIPVRVASEYRKVSFSHSDLRDFSDRNMYTNVCEYIDNNFLYYNADIKTHDKTKAKDNPKLSAVLENVKRKNGPYAACLNASNASNTKGFIVSDTNIPVVCRNCVTATNQDECLYNNDECKAYAYQYGCRVQHCSGESLKYCEEEDNILNRIVDCGKYKGGPNSYKNYFDCGLYYSTSDNEKKIFKDFETLIGANNISYIQKACDSTLPLEDTRPIISPDTLSKLIKPYKTTASSDGAKNQSLAKTDLERYGCIKFNSPTAGYGLYGCKIPKDDSSYITMSQNPSTAINGMDVDNLDNLKKPKDAKLKLSICSRYPSDVEKDGKCGYREGSAFKDTCVDITDSGEATLEDTSSHCWFFTESSGGSRFRSEQRTKRDILVFRDFHTYHYCYSDISKEFKDGISAAIISGEGALAGTALAAVVCIAPCLATIPFYPVCLGVCSGATILITIGAFMLARIEDWQINLQNDIQIARGYNSVAGYEEKGFISKAFLTDNNNYAYIFYPRYDDIEKDLKSKLENNLSNGQRFFHRNTTGSEIIKKCNISNLFVESNNCNGIDSCDYSYGYNKLKDDGSVEGVCNEGDLEKCLHATQTACLKAYGVSFVKNSGIDDDFLTKSGGFLKHFKDGDITKEDWGTSSNKDNRGYVPVDVIYFTKDKQSVENLKANANCKLGAYGDPVGDLSRCRGFEHEGVFYTESQAAKMPLLTSPFLFYTLITPRNTPELFDPTLIITGYYRFSDLTSERSYNRPDDVILDFFNPKIRYDYSFLGGVNDPDFENLLAYENDAECKKNPLYNTLYVNGLLSEVESDKMYSGPYVLKYKSNNITERKYEYVLHKTYSNDLHNEFIPQVCIYRIMAMPTDSSGSSFIELETCAHIGCMAKPSSNYGFIVIDNNVECYPRRPIDLDELILKPDESMTYNRSYINAYIKPKGKNYASVKGDKAYELVGPSGSYVETIGESRVQGYGLNFTRSYCSRPYRDYYIYLDQVERERTSPGKDIAKINRLLRNISIIENTVIPDCDNEDGVVAEVLVNESNMKTLSEANGDVVAKQIAKVRKYNESYGGHNEICISDYDIEEIFKLRREFGLANYEMPEVLVFKDEAGRKLKTKCVLDSSSMSKEACLQADVVYMYCTDFEINQTTDCMKVLDVNSYREVFVKAVNCRQYLGEGIINEDNIKYIKACFKGGFNYIGNIHNVDGNREEVCSCRTIAFRGSFDTDLYSSRTMTPREYGLCVDLKKPIICPAVRYYDASKEYLNDELALGKTEEELTIEDYEQHRWRTQEKQVGILPAVFFTMTLGHAEFPASVYCEADKLPFGGDETKNEEYFNENCIGGNRFIKGECIGFWKQNGTNEPRAICTVRSGTDGTTIYEYELVRDADTEGTTARNRYECIRYNCPNIGYDDLGYVIVDERDIDTKSSTLFSAVEINEYTNVLLTDYRSFKNYEEKDSKTVDTRGALNGFAIWKKTESSDFAELVTSKQCLTGFAPAGSNYNIKIGFYSDDDAINYDSLANNYSNIVNLYGYQVANAKSYSSQRFPKRLCNQKGKWLVVQDIYNSGAINTEIRSANFYYNSPENFWMSVLGNDAYMGMADDQGKYGTNYCERLLCRGIEPGNVNIYLDEVLNRTKSVEYGQKSAYTTWRHSGGANWDNTTSARNSSSLVDITGVSGNASRNVTNIFNAVSISDNVVDNKYKYVRKVQGTCVNIFGYYNRNSKFFNSGDFTSQLFTLEPQGTIGVDPRETTLLDESVQVKSPSRVCTSVGMWGGITDRCFRACEMINIYNTEVNPVLYENKVNLTASTSYFIENHHILTVDTRNDRDLDENYRENRLALHHLRESDKFNNFTRGDFLTGGATWPRSIVISGSGIESGNNSKKGLRYIEVVGNCDSTYDRRIDNQPSQYVLLSLDKTPKRKCYEDGTWGQVYEETRCLLAKNCIPFDFLVDDLAGLVGIVGNGATLADINIFIANVYYNQDYSLACSSEDDPNPNYPGNKNYREKYGCKLPRFEAKDTTINTVLAGENGGSDAFSKNELVVKDTAYQAVSKIAYPTICCLSESCNSGSKTYNAGWNVDSIDIGEYFVPKTCRIANSISDTNYSTDNFYVDSTGGGNVGSVENLNYLNRLEFISDGSKSPALHYARDSLLHFVYNRVNGDAEGRYFETTFLDSLIIDDSAKDITIGLKNYKSYQVSAKCNDSIFYNAHTGDSYFAKNIIFECKAVTGGTKFAYNKNTKANEAVGVKTISAKDCLPKTCGGTTNKYQRIWTSSIVKEASDNHTFYGLGGDVPAEPGHISKLSCGDNPKNDIETAFVISYGETLSESKNVDKFYKIGTKSYRDYNFVETLKTNCVASSHEDGKINGTAKLNDYDAHTIGNLDYNTLPHMFCKDIGKSVCVSVSETELMNSAEFKNMYCIKMACPGKNLKFNSGTKKIEYNQTSEYFNLPDLDYAFNKVVVIQSYDEDYNDDKALGSITIDKRYVQYDYNGKSGDGMISGATICSANEEDIYNDTTSNYSIDRFITDNNKNRETVSSCLDLLDNAESSIKRKTGAGCDEGYTDVQGSTCVKYNSSGYGEVYKGIEGLRAAANSYVASDNLKNSAVNFIMAMNPLHGSIQARLDQINAEAAVYAKTEATNDFKGATSGLVCKYDDEITTRSGLESKYDGITWYTTSDGVIYGFVKNGSSDTGCTKTVTTGEGEGAVVTTHIGKLLLEKTIFDGYYSSRYTSERNQLRDTLISKIKSESTGDSSITSLYREYYRVFRMKDFLLNTSTIETETDELGNSVQVTVYTNLENYNTYLEHSIGSHSNLSVMYALDGTTELFMLQGGATVDTGEAVDYGVNFTASVVNQYFCNVVTGEAKIPCSSAMAGNYKMDSRDVYEKYFLNFLDSSVSAGSDDSDSASFSPRYQIEQYIKGEETSKNTCISIYREYSSSKVIYEGNTTGALFRSGFFMVMKCTEDGWIVLDAPSCKKRCLVESKTMSADPTGTGSWEVRITADKIRHASAYKFTISSHAKSACCLGSKSSDRGHIEFGCEDGVVTGSLSRNKYGDGLNWEVNDQAHGCWAAVLAGWAAVFGCKCDKMKCSSRSTITGSVGSSYRGAKNAENHVIYVCPGDTGGDTGATSTKECSTKLDNSATLKYIINSK